jgi:beta-galactosidase
MLPVIGALRPWLDPTVVQLNRLPAHVPLSGLDRRSLDGRWSLEMFDRPDVVPAAALTADRRRAIDVEVPGNWTMQDLGDFVDTPQYTNVRMPFPGPPPILPERNPTGVYRRSFVVPSRWAGRRTVVHIGGAESVHAVYVNGEFVGYGTDSRLPSEYDLSDYVRTGRNDIAIVALRYSAHSYVEDQDQWWMAGLHRSVWIESRPRVHIADLPITTDYDPESGRGIVEATTHVDFSGAPEQGWTVVSTLHDPSGRSVGRTDERAVPHRHASPYVFTGFTTSARWEFGRAKPWSAEQPARYVVTVELRDPRGRSRHTERQAVGLRRVEVRDRQLLVNGQAIWIFGVNRHDHHPDRGKAVTIDDMRADLMAMRTHNITAIRTSHYPNDSAFYDLCDELGFYVIDEANTESHAYNRSLCDDPTYRATWLDRGARMVQRDRNHPSVIVWSLGNESGYGANHDALAGWIRRTDPSRPLHYEDAIRVEGWTDGGLHATDIVCPMYPEIDEIRRYGEDGLGTRPLIMCEYNHAMGNSNGSLADYWDVITTTPGLQGGFLWEWKDHGLRQTLAGGKQRLAYGGQFGDEPNDGNFVADGLVSPDLEPHPAMREVAWVHRPITVERTRGGLRITNRQSFSDLRGFRATWELTIDDEVTGRGALQVPKVRPAGDAVVPLPCEIPGETADVALTTRWTTRHDAWFAPAGHLVAWDQVLLRKRTTAAPHPRHTGGNVSDMLSSTPRLNLWRAAIDNDGFKLLPELAKRIGVGGQALARWQQAGLDRRDPEELVGHDMLVEADGDGVTYRHEVTVPDELADLPRVGVTFGLPARFRNVRWFGRGPHENYPDRNRSAMLGVWEGPPDDMPYLVPQEFGLRTDCRWIEFDDPDTDETIRVDVLEPVSLHMSATNYSSRDLFNAADTTELQPHDELHRHDELPPRDLVVSLDAAHRGLGTAGCGPDVLDRYRVEAGTYRFAYRITRR